MSVCRQAPMSCEASAGIRSGLLSLPIHSLATSVTTTRKRRFPTMAAATTSATMAAAGYEKRPTINVSSLPTPRSGTLPSELLSPMVSSPCVAKKEEAFGTPITPPSAYLDFLKSHSSTIPTPASTTSPRFNFNDITSLDRSSDRITDISKSKPSSTSPPTSQPPLSRNTSSDSTSTDRSITSTNSAATNTSTRPASPRVIIPPSQFLKPAPRSSSRTPRRLQIPQSPFSPSLPSAQSLPSPYTTTPLTVTPWSATFSPREHLYDLSATTSGQPGKVHVRQVVTRTVTYCRTPLNPAPKGKRRKISEEDDAGSITSRASVEEEGEGVVKKERVGRIEEEGDEAEQNEVSSANEVEPTNTT